MEKAKEEAGKNIVEALEETATNPENIAFLLGRILRGVGGLDKLFLGKASPAKTMAEVTLGKIAFVTVECAILVAALHLPEGFLAVTEKSIAQLAKDLQKSFATKEKIQIILDDPVAKKIAGEILQPGVKAELEKLDKPLNDLKKTIDNYIEETKDLE
jgi:DNA mismatch repair ATPase MutS